MDNVSKLVTKVSAHIMVHEYHPRILFVLQLRDETYERYKNKPPLDTYRTCVISISALRASSTS